MTKQTDREATTNALTHPHTHTNIHSSCSLNCFPNNHCATLTYRDFAARINGSI